MKIKAPRDWLFVAAVVVIIIITREVRVYMGIDVSQWRRDNAYALLIIYVSLAAVGFLLGAWAGLPSTNTNLRRVLIMLIQLILIIVAVFVGLFMVPP